MRTFVCDLLNFSFWQTEEVFTVECDGKVLDGYATLPVCLNRAHSQNPDILKPWFYSSCDKKVLRDIFVGTSGKIPLLDERVEILQESGRILMAHFDGSVSKLISLANNSAISLVRILVENFPSFRDAAQYKGQLVYFFKRAQIFAADLNANLRGEGLGFFEDLDDLTMFADYRVPQALQYFNLLQYSPALLQALSDGEHFENGDGREVEIRACSVVAVDLLVKELCAQTGKKITSPVVDYMLWKIAKTHSREMFHLLIHRTRCMFY